MRQRGNIAVLGLPTAIGLWFFYDFALRYLTSEPHQFGIYQPRHQWLYVHILAGMVALLIGPAQLWLGMNKRTAILHRILGVLYVVAVGAGGTAAFYLAVHNDFGWVFGVGFFSMTMVWIVTTALATIAILMHRVEQHREWMIRSYVVTFGFVTFRVTESVLDLANVGTMVEQLTAASWLAWTVPLFITESIMQGRKIFKKPVPVPMLRETRTYTLQPEAGDLTLQNTDPRVAPQTFTARSGRYHS